MKTLPKRFNYAEAYLTFRCNLGCSYCINKFDGLKPRKEMTADEWADALNDIDFGNVSLTLGGGEPTQFKGFFELVDKLKMPIDLLTNLQFDVEEFIKNVNPDIIIAFHSDGAIQKIIPHLIEIGVDVLNPLQPECMDIFEIKRIYGDKLSFWGTIGTQTTMPFGTVDEVKEAVKKSIQEIGKDGGLLIAPTHLLEPEVPWENIMAFVEAVRDYGKY